MREIKFRAWLKEEKRMTEPFTLEEFAADQDSEYGNFDFGFSHNENVIMQFTGLKDKNGKEIYEGDIVKYGDFAFNDTRKFGKNPWELFENGTYKGFKEDDITTIEDTFEVEYNFYDLSKLQDYIEDNPDVSGVEVIGNIYENKDLLK